MNGCSVDAAGALPGVVLRNILLGGEPNFGRNASGFEAISENQVGILLRLICNQHLLPALSPFERFGRSLAHNTQARDRHRLQDFVLNASAKLHGGNDRQRSFQRGIRIVNKPEDADPIRFPTP